MLSAHTVLSGFLGDTTHYKFEPFFLFCRTRYETDQSDAQGRQPFLF